MQFIYSCFEERKGEIARHMDGVIKDVKSFEFKMKVLVE